MRDLNTKSPQKVNRCPTPKREAPQVESWTQLGGLLAHVLEACAQAYVKRNGGGK